MEEFYIILNLVHKDMDLTWDLIAKTWALWIAIKQRNQRMNAIQAVINVSSKSKYSNVV